MTNPPAVSPLLLALYQGDEQSIERLRAQRPELDLFEAAALGDAARLLELLDRDPESANRRSPDGFPVVGLAAFFGHTDAVALLLQRGADPNAPADNAMKVTSLHAAVARRHRDIALLLLAHGADPNAVQEGGWTPLHQAADHGDDVLVRALLDRGADPEATNDGGLTSRAMALAKSHAEVVALLC